jgi:hypothetical protein
MRRISNPKILNINQQVGNTAMIQLGESGKDSQGRFVACGTGPSFPIRKVLECLGIIRPQVVPMVSCILLTPAMHQT